MNKTDKNNNITIIGLSDMSIFILESLVSSNRNYNITLIYDKKEQDENNISLNKFSNIINLKSESLLNSYTFNSNENSNNILTICATNDYKLNLLFSALIKSSENSDNIFCYVNNSQYHDLFKKEDIVTFNPWNLPKNLSSFWK